MSKTEGLPVTVAFTYEDSEGEITDRIVKVFGFEISDHGLWYAQGFCHLAWKLRTFRVDRIIDPVTEMETGEVISIPDWMERITGMRPDVSSFEALREQARHVRESRGLRIPRPVQPGKGVHFTGFKAANKAELEALVPQVGWHVRKSMSATVDIVVAGYNAGPKKVQEALDNGIAVVSEKVFREMCVAAQKFNEDNPILPDINMKNRVPFSGWDTSGCFFSVAPAFKAALDIEYTDVIDPVATARKRDRLSIQLYEMNHRDFRSNLLSQDIKLGESEEWKKIMSQVVYFAKRIETEGSLPLFSFRESDSLKSKCGE